MRYLQRGLTHRDPHRATPGFTLFTPLRNSTAYIVNMAGEIVHQWDRCWYANKRLVPALFVEAARLNNTRVTLGRWKEKDAVHVIVC